MNKKLKEKRTKSGFTQEQVAEMAEISVRAYQYIELNGRVPNVHTAQFIARALGTTVEELFPINAD